MADMSFDVVYAGGGYGALMSAPYFLMNGMSVGMFEALPELGGGHASDARPVPGFVGNPHAHAIAAQMAPQCQDFKLHEYGGFLRLPTNIIDCAYTDGSGFRIKLANQFIQETGEMDFDYAIYQENYESLAKMSKVDADLCQDILQKILQGWMFAVMMDWLNPPPRHGQLEWLEKLYNDPDIPIDPRLQYLNPVQVAKEFFEDRRFQMAYIRLVNMLGFWPDRPITPIMSVLCAGYMLGFMGAGYWEGGTHQIVHVLQRVMGELGGKSYVNHPVDKIIVENGKAKGIVLEDGTQIEAKKFVVTNVDPRQLTFRFLRDVQISDIIKKKLNNLEADAATLFWGNVAHHEVPHYIQESKIPNFGRDAFAVIMGDDDVDYLLENHRYKNQHIRPGQWPDKLYFWVSAIGELDPRMTVEGKYNTLVEELGPPASSMSEREWHQVRKEIGPRMLEEWRKYAPNMTDDNVIGVEIDTPGDFARRDEPCIEGSWQMGVAPVQAQWGRYRPIYEYSDYKVPGVEGLYCTGIGWHSNFGSPAGFAYNMYKQCAWDNGLREFWKEAGRDW